MEQTQLTLIMISHAATPAMRRGQFPADASRSPDDHADDTLDARAIAAVHAWRQRISLAALANAFSSPAQCAIATAHELRLSPTVATALADADAGRWGGRRLNGIAASEPEALAGWLHDPAAAAHGGEAFNDVLARVSKWMDGLAPAQTVIAVTHAAVMRAAILHAIQGTPASFRHIEIAPLALVRLSRSMRGWVWQPGTE